jgi:PAS domain S-box-containing protein
VFQSPRYRISPPVWHGYVLASLERLTAVDEALKQGAWDYVVKQPDLSHIQEIPQAITRNVEWKKLRVENQHHQDEKRWLAAALLESPEGIFVADQEGRIVFTNPELEDLLGYTGEELVGESIDRVLSSFQTNESAWTEVSHPFTHKRWQGNVILKKKDGSDSTVRTKMTQLLDEAGETTALIGFCLNSKQDAPGAKTSAPPPAQPSQASSDEVFSTITGDLKTPLAAMLGYLEMALTIGTDQAEAHQILSIKRVEVLARRLYDLVTNHSEAAVMEAGQFEVQKAPMHMVRIVDQAVKDREREANVKKITIVQEIAKDLPTVFLDGIQMERAVGILINNAIDLSPLGGKVTVGLLGHGKQIVVGVRSSGAPFSAEELPFLFDRRKKLRRGGEEINTVGLYVAQQIVAQHGGRIDIQKGTQEGTTLLISVPM